MHANGFHYASNPAGNHHLRRLIVVVALTAALIIPGSLVAAKKGGAQPGGEDPSGNNLSVPTYFVGPNADAATGSFAVRCPSAAVPPAGDPDGYFDPPDAAAGRYYLQGVSDWQAECKISVAAKGVIAVWGDNLINGKPFQPNKPIRIEMKLETNRNGTGYPVVKLEDTLDRLALYGTKGSPKTMPYMVWGPGQSNLAILNEELHQIGDPLTMGAEINSTGKVVYGYSWRASAGTYWLKFTAPSGVTIAGVNGGDDTAYRPAYALVKIVVGHDGSGGQKGGKH